MGNFAAICDIVHTGIDQWLANWNLLVAPFPSTSSKNDDARVSHWGRCFLRALTCLDTRCCCRPFLPSRLCPYSPCPASQAVGAAAIKPSNVVLSGTSVKSSSRERHEPSQELLCERFPHPARSLISNLGHVSPISAFSCRIATGGKSVPAPADWGFVRKYLKVNTACLLTAAAAGGFSQTDTLWRSMFGEL